MLYFYHVLKGIQLLYSYHFFLLLLFMKIFLSFFHSHIYLFYFLKPAFHIVSVLTKSNSKVSVVDLNIGYSLYYSCSQTQSASFRKVLNVCCFGQLHAGDEIKFIFLIESLTNSGHVSSSLIHFEGKYCKENFFLYGMRFLYFFLIFSLNLFTSYALFT